jgi:hypothetical protein
MAAMVSEFSTERLHDNRQKAKDVPETRLNEPVTQGDQYGMYEEVFSASRAASGNLPQYFRGPLEDCFVPLHHASRKYTYENARKPSRLISSCLTALRSRHLRSCG